MRVREVTLDDAAALAPLVSALGYPTDSSEMRERLIVLREDPSYKAFLAETDSKPIGLAGVRLGAFFEKNWPYAQLVILVVAEEGRGVGVGAALVQTVERYARSNGAKELIVTSGSHRGDAHRFYARCGFRATGVRLVKELDTT